MLTWLMGTRAWALGALVIGTIFAVLIALGKAFKAGKASVEVEIAKEGEAAKGRMVEAAVEAPKTRKDIIAGMREGKFCLALLAMLLPLASCAPVVKIECPPIVEYDAAYLNEAADAWAELPPDSPLDRMLVDYRQLRAVLRACNAK